ncbi:MAG: hypothetical protein M1834_006459 [Cirrosporium novae-zelandiae]|nr:MAG: hypothetical protein M1834_006459 [Cirrosporium novae-zelandiae]
MAASLHSHSCWARAKHAFSSPHAFHQALILKSSSSRLVNEDLLPSPPDRWTWDTWSFFSYWWSESWAVSTWSIGSSLIALGATVRDALLVVLFANTLSAIIIVLNGRAASRYHVGFPVLTRISFGMYGQYFSVILRSILGIIWGGVQMYFEGKFISICLRCIFPGWAKIPNQIPASQHITTTDMVGFFLAFLFTIPFMFIHTTKIRYIFTIKSFLIPLTGLGIVCWATTANGSVSADNLVDTSTRTSTAVFAWGIVGQFNSVMGANSALLVTVPDLARYSKTKNAQLWGQAFGLPFSGVICSAFGIITTSAVQHMYGETYWNTYDLLDGILNHTCTPKSRAGVFFASASWAFATMGTSIACNITPFAADITSLFPKYINIIRGQLLCTIIAFSITPWNIVATANSFLTFLSGYSIFQGSIVSIMIVDYFLLRNGNINITALYSTAPSSQYHYIHGFNPRAFLAFVAGFALPLPGFIASFGHSVGAAAEHMFVLGWILSFLMGGLSYLLMGRIWKVPGDDVAYGFEAKVSEAQMAVIDGVHVDHGTRETETETEIDAAGGDNDGDEKVPRVNNSSIV